MTGKYPRLQSEQEKWMENHVFDVRGKLVMFDFDLASLFSIPLRRIKEQVNRNPKRYTKGFCFRLTVDEASSFLESNKARFQSNATLRSLQNAYIFTESGILVLISSMHLGDVSHILVRLSEIFASLNEARRIDSSLRERVSSLETKLLAVENEMKKNFEILFDYVDEDAYPKQMTFMNGQRYDAHELISSLFEKANKSILIIDPYFDKKALHYCKLHKQGVSITACCLPCSRLNNRDIDIYRNQYGQITLKKNNKFHDRYLIIDGKEGYHLGTSLNTIGKRVCGIDRIDDPDVLTMLSNKVYSI